MNDRRSVQVTQGLLRRLVRIRDAVNAAEKEHASALGAVPATSRKCATNLVNYVTLRRHDLRGIQRWLHTLGLSSLGHTESHVREGLDGVIELLQRVVGVPNAPPLVLHQKAMRRAQMQLKRRTLALLGAPTTKRSVRIMVTMPSEASTSAQLVKDLLAAGMDCMRINCAHDGPEAWVAMIDNLKAASAELNRPCRVLMDLAGPKLRTGPVATGPSVRRCRPPRDAQGRTTAPAHVTLVPEGAPTPYSRGDITVPASSNALAELRAGDVLQFTDARGKERELAVVSADSGAVVCEAWKSAYLAPGIELSRIDDPISLKVADFTGKPGRIDLHVGDSLILDNRADWPGSASVRDGDGNPVRLARISFTLPEVFGHIKIGQPVFFDDGKIGAVVEAVDRASVTLRITHTRPGGSALQADKGVNLPETALHLPAINTKDKEHLAFAIAHADMVGLSFVRTAKDVEALFRALREGGGTHLGVVLKIETRQAVMHLPDLLLAALQHDKVGVMIARGDLAVECDFRRMAELQEEILWFCEAAHVPVIWATEVLAQLAKTGTPTRAEITDAAMAERAECVMLNKGPYILEAIRTLDDILLRMSGHQHKKMARLRPLRLASLTADPPPAPAGPANQGATTQSPAMKRPLPTQARA